VTGTAIWGIGKSSPERVLTNDDLVAMLDTSDEWIQTRTGIRERRIAADDETTSTFAVGAAQVALERAGVDPSDLDHILVATVTPDEPVPGAAPLVQHALGATKAAALDVNGGCCGFIHGLQLASALVASGQSRRVLVCGSETLSRIIDWTDRSTAVLFGDGSGAAVVGPADDARLGPFVCGTDGSKRDLLYVPAGGSKLPASEETVAAREHTIRMKGQDVYKFATEKMTETARALLHEIPADDVDLVVAHQANARIIRTVAERLSLRDDQVVCNVDRYGNTSAASIPIALTEQVDEGRLQDGMLVLLVAFGAGFSWAGGLVRWGRR